MLYTEHCMCSLKEWFFYLKQPQIGRHYLLPLILKENNNQLAVLQYSIISIPQYKWLIFFNANALLAVVLAIHTKKVRPKYQSRPSGSGHENINILGQNNIS